MSDLLKMDKSSFSIMTEFAENEKDEKLFWKQKTPEERIQAIEQMRQILYGYNSSARLQTFLEIAQLQKD